MIERRGRFPEYAQDMNREMWMNAAVAGGYASHHNDPHMPAKPDIGGARVSDDLNTAYQLVRERLDGLRQAGLGAVVAPVDEALADAWNVVRVAGERVRFADDLYEQLAEKNATLDRVRSLATYGTPEPPKPPSYLHSSPRADERPIGDIVCSLHDSQVKHLQLIDTIAESSIKHSKLLADHYGLQAQHKRAVALIAALRKQLHTEVKAGRLVRGAVARIFRTAERAVTE